MTGRPFIGELIPTPELTPTPEPAPMPDLPGYSHFIFQSRHASHEALGLRMHTRPMPTISMKTKVTKMAYLSRCTICSAQWSCKPPLPPPQHEGVFWTAPQPPYALYRPQPSPLQPQPHDMHPQFAHAVSTPHEPP